MKNNFYIQKDGNVGEVVYVEFNERDCYRVTPKIKKEDTIEVTKIVFVSKNLSEKIIKKKIEHKIAHLLQFLDEDNNDGGEVKRSLMEAERLKLMIINNYTKYLGNTYQSLTLKKIQLIIEKLRYKLYDIYHKSNVLFVEKEYSEEEKRGRSR